MLAYKTIESFTYYILSLHFTYKRHRFTRLAKTVSSRIAILLEDKSLLQVLEED